MLHATSAIPRLPRELAFTPAHLKALGKGDKGKKLLRTSLSSPAVKFLHIPTVTDTIHRPTSNKQVLTSGQASCRSILQSPGEILLEKGLARTPLTQTSAADMVPAALNRGPTTNSRREARTRGYTEAESQVTHKQAPRSERQRKKKSMRPWDTRRAIPFRQLMQGGQPNQGANSK